MGWRWYHLSRPLSAVLLSQAAASFLYLIKMEASRSTTLMIINKVDSQDPISTRRVMCIWTVELLGNSQSWIDLLLDVAFPAEVISVFLSHLWEAQLENRSTTSTFAPVFPLFFFKCANHFFLWWGNKRGPIEATLLEVLTSYFHHKRTTFYVFQSSAFQKRS